MDVFDCVDSTTYENQHQNIVPVSHHVSLVFGKIEGKIKLLFSYI